MEKQEELENANEPSAAQIPEQIGEEDFSLAIGELLDAIERLEHDNSELRSEIAALRELISGHEQHYEHVEQQHKESEPGERHLYFRRIGRA